MNVHLLLDRVSDYKGDPDHAAATYNLFMNYELMRGECMHVSVEAHLCMRLCALLR